MEVKEYLKNFNEHSEYVSYTASTEYVTPNVSLCLHPFEVHYGKESPIPPVEPIYQWVEDGFMCDNFDKYVQEKKQVSYDEGTTWQDTGETRKGTLIEEKSADCGYIPPTPKNYLTFVAVDNCQFKFSGNGITYSVDDGETWNTLNYAELSPVVPAGSKIMWKGTLTPMMRTGIGTFAGTGRYEAEGNPMSLLYGDDFEGQISVASFERAFAYIREISEVTVNENNTVYDSRNNCNAIIETATNVLILGCKNTVIPNEIVKIGDYAYCAATGLTSISFNSNITELGENAFYGCKSLQQIVIPDTITTIGSSAFHDCSGATSVSIGAGIDEIPDSCFYCCSGLTTVDIPDTITNIGRSAFNGCSHMQTVTIGTGVTNISWWAFNWSRQITKVTIKAVNPPTLDISAFYNNSSSRKFYVPADSVEAYKTADQWTNYADKIVAIT